MLRIHSEPFGMLPDGRQVNRHVVTNRIGAQVSVIDYGAIVTSIIVPDGCGRLGEVTLGYTDLREYLDDKYYFGAVIGRFANRIAQGRFLLDGVRYVLAQNDGLNHLHGGWCGFGKTLWKSRHVNDSDFDCLQLLLESPEGDGGYPGALQVRVQYTFDDACRLRVDYDAVTTKPTVLNLTQHSYFNLAGSGSILDHELELKAGRFTPIDATSIPTGEIRNVEGTPFDFRCPTAIGARIDTVDEQIRLAHGYDHNFVLDGASGVLKWVATLSCSRSQRVLRVLTTEPGLQLYSGNSLPKCRSITRGGERFGYREGLCLETPHFPDSPNRAKFPSTRLEPGQSFHSTTVFEFTTIHN
jgi:aldose 1-epimerase